MLMMLSMLAKIAELERAGVPVIWPSQRGSAGHVASAVREPLAQVGEPTAWAPYEMSPMLDLEIPAALVELA